PPRCAVTTIMPALGGPSRTSSHSSSVKSALPVILRLLSRLTTEMTPAEKLRQQTLSSAGPDQDKQEYDCEGGKAKVQLQQHVRLLSVGARVDDRAAAPAVSTACCRDSVANQRHTVPQLSRKATRRLWLSIPTTVQLALACGLGRLNRWTRRRWRAPNRRGRRAHPGARCRVVATTTLARG